MPLRAPLVNGARSGPPRPLPQMNHRTGTPLQVDDIPYYVLLQRPFVVQRKLNRTLPIYCLRAIIIK